MNRDEGCRCLWSPVTGRIWCEHEECDHPTCPHSDRFNSNRPTARSGPYIARDEEQK